MGDAGSGQQATRRKPGFRPLTWALAALAVGLTLSGAAAYWRHTLNLQEAAQQFDGLAVRAASRVAERMRRYEHELRGLRGAVLAAGGRSFTGEQMERYGAMRDIDQEFPGARGFGVIWRIPPAEEAAFVAAARQDLPSFAIRAIAPHDDERAVIRFIEPVARNRQAVGLDIASEPRRRAAAQAAMRQGSATLTAPITLVQATGKAAESFLLLLPIYRFGLPTGTEAERVAAALGWTYAPLVTDEVLAGLDLFEGQLALRLNDLAAPVEGGFYSSPAFAAQPVAGLERVIELPVYGRRWQMTVHATPAFVRAHPHTDPLRLAIASAGVSLGLAGAVYLAAIGAARKRRAQQEQARRAAIVDSSEDAVIAETLDGIVTEWNDAAGRLFGYRADEAIGRPLAELLLPPERRHEEAELGRALRQGVRRPPFDTTRLHRDGTLIDVSLSAVPILDGAGRPVALAKSLRDLREVQQARRALAEANAALERQVAERTASLDQALHDLRSILDAVPSMIGYWDRQLTNRVANQAYATWFGVDPGALRGKSMLELLGPDLFERNRPYIEAALKGQPQVFERAIPRPDGKGVRHSLAHYLPDVVNGEVQGFYVLVHDVTDITESRLQLAAAQRENAALLHTLEHHSIVSVADRNGRIVSVSEGFCRISGYSAEELIGRDHRVVSSGHHPAEFWRAMWHTAQGQAWHAEVCNRAKDGSLYWVDSVIAPFFDAEGRIEKYVSICTDITPIKRLQQEAEAAHLHAAEASRFLREMTDRLPLRLGYIDKDLRYRFVNAAQCRFLGLDRDQLIGRTRQEATGRPLPEALRRRHEAALRGEASSYEHQEVVDGTAHTYDVRLVPDRDADGQVIGFFAVSADITDRKQAENELRQTLTLLRAVLDASTQVSIIAVNPDGRIRVFNRGAEQMLGYAAEEVVGRETSMHFHDRDELRARAAELSERLGRKVHSGMALVEPEVMNEPHEWTYRRKDGSTVPVSLAVTAMHDDEGQLVGYLGIAYDISLRRQYEDSLRQAMHEARRADRAKSQFLANMSHEIRTPMNAVIGFARLLEDTPLDADQRGLVTKLRNAGTSLMGLINDVLDLSKIEAGEMTLEAVPFSLHQLLAEQRDLFEAQAVAKGIRFELNLAPGLPDGLVGDPTRLRQVLVNLIGNALKFTSRGGVTLSAEADTAQAGRVRLRLRVRDTGIGIDAEAQRRLFQPFVQADDSTTRRFGGTGLGLAIVKQLVELMSGQVRLNSSPGVGSEFVAEIELPLAGTTTLVQPTEAAPSRDALAGTRILVVDDSEINLEVASRLLQRFGAQVRTCAGARDGIDALRHAPEAFDIVLMDVQMPELDGLQATRIVRQELGLTRLPVIALTAGVTADERARALAAGMDAVVSKPLDPEGLVRTILKALGRADKGPAPAAAAGEADWPEIEGIRIAEARARFAGDWPLFASLLRRLITTEPAALETLLNNPLDREALAAQMHRLKGTAGTLGAKAVEQHAGAAERAGRSGDDAAALRDAQQALQALRELAAHSAAALAAASAETERPSVPASAEPAALRELLALLQGFDLSALDQFRVLTTNLKARLDAAAYEALRADIEELNFAAAAAIVETLVDA